MFLHPGLPYEEKDYDYEADNENNEIENDADSAKVYPTPIFTTESSNMMVNEGDTVRLPCIVDRLEGFVMLWKRSDEIVRDVPPRKLPRSLRCLQTYNSPGLKE